MARLDKQWAEQAGHEEYNIPDGSILCVVQTNSERL